MNSFKESLAINKRKLVDSAISSKFYVQLQNEEEKLLEEKATKSNRKAEEIKQRKEGISQIFKNYDRNMEGIHEYDAIHKINFQNSNKNKSKTDEEIQKTILETGKELYNQMYDNADKVQVLDRMLGIRMFLENFEENMDIIKQRNEEISKKNQSKER